MRILSLSLKNFRNYKETTIPFSSGINLIIGENGSGKTNLIEALYLFITGRSFRTHRLADLISFGESFFILELRFIKNDIEQTLKIVANAQQRKVFHNETPITHLSALFGILRGVILSPKDSELVTGSPTIRRHFLDLHIAQVNSHYLAHLSRYMRAKKQRDSLLRHQETKMLDIWEDQMSLSAEFLSKERQKAIVELEEEAKPFQACLSRNKDKLSLSYHFQAKNSMDIAQFYRNQYSIFRQKELHIGYSLIGSHRDDLRILLADKEARAFGSIGQIRSTALSLRFAEFSRFKKITQESPLFFLDDLAVGLDDERERNLFRYISQCDQSFLTSPRKTFDLEFPKQQLHLICVEDGVWA